MFRGSTPTMSGKLSKRAVTREYLMKMLFQMESQGDFTDARRDAFLSEYAAGDITKELNEKLEQKYSDDPENMPEKYIQQDIAGNLSKYLDMEYYYAAFEAYIMHNNDIDDIIDDFSKGWSVDRIAKVDLSVLRLCITEMLYLKKPKVPVSASISEAVRIAKIYGGEDSGKFVNGILGKIAREQNVQ